VLPSAAVATGHHLVPFFHRVGDMRFDLLDRLYVDQRPDHRARLEPVGDLHCSGGRSEALRKASYAATVRLTQTQVWPALRYFDAIAPFHNRTRGAQAER
jgi:hypothetical protein